MTITKFYEMNNVLATQYAAVLLNSGKFELMPPPNTLYENIGCVIKFKSKEMYVAFIQDRGMEVSCSISVNELDFSFLEDVLYSIDVKMPKHNDDFLELIQVASKVIVDNYDEILKAFDKENIKETQRRISSSAKLRW